MTSNDQETCKRYVWFGPCDDGIALRFEPTFAVALGSDRRAKAVIRRVLRLLRRLKLEAAQDGNGASATIRQPSFDMSGLLTAIDAEIAAFQAERIYPKEVDEILAISSRERRRWTKDGRLPTSGHTSFRSGKNSVFLVLYPPAPITALAHRPEQIEAWRRADAAASAPATGSNDTSTA
ncbi:hypothetical protein [Rhodopseudomonas palustris]|uniref:hypothetical protein n=1 Tax=Rhodopseudomonas palustris TaxID=1076 RepID=UPI000CEC629E|nr:hypothetical protein [Rhodopseudomonas palustris]PPQ42342.1 hypothetical protein CKO39_17750 [Rhodopseudomonas palustris]